MPEYFIAYHKGEGVPEKPEEHTEKFMEWVSGLGKAVIMPGMPLGRGNPERRWSIRRGWGAADRVLYRGS